MENKDTFIFEAGQNIPMHYHFATKVVNTTKPLIHMEFVDKYAGLALVKSYYKANSNIVILSKNNEQK